MQLKWHTIFIILICFLSPNLFGQSTYQNFVPNIAGKSPTSASFEKYGDYPANLYSGLPEISIPLYTIESGDLKIPITLSYHASGIKVDQAASWVGLGWTLSSGGTVSRTVNGLPDEERGYFYTYKHPGSYNQNSTQDVSELYATVVDKSIDTRPDIFSYNLPGYNGKFFFSKLDSLKVKMIPYSPIRIKNTAVNVGVDTPKFSILDERGNSFILGNQYRETSFTTSTSSRPGKSATTSWMLERMVSQNKHDTIRFTYTPQSLFLPDQTGQVLNVEDQGIVNNNYDGGVYAVNTWTAQPSNSSTSVTEQDPKEIFFKNGKVVFKLAGTTRTDLNASNQPYPLDIIQVFKYDFVKKQYESTPQKSIVFKRSYFSVITGGKARLRLDGIQILDKTGNLVQEYKFAYDTTPLPDYASYSKDFWGYYNGKMDNPSINPKTLIPRTRIFVETGQPTAGANYYRYIGSSDSTSRLPDTVKMQAGILKRIDYPTGGFTTFSYETNRFIDDSLITRFVGGLRVSSIASYNNPTTTVPLLKTYRYNIAKPNYLTNGTNFINYGFFMVTLPVIYVGSGPNGGGLVVLKSKRTRLFYSESSSALTSSDGNPIAYTNVTEYTGTPSINIGKTEYSYQQTNNQYSPGSQTTGLPVQIDLFFKRGQLLNKADYLRKSDGTYQLLKDESHEYSAFPPTNYENVGVIVGQRRQAETSSGYSLLYLANYPGDDMNAYSYPWIGYTIASGDSYPIATTTTVYDQNDPTKFQSSKIEYKYDNFKHQQVSRILTTDSKGNRRVTVNKYASDYLIGGGTTTNSFTLNKMLESNMQGVIIEKWDSLRNVNTGINSIVSAQLNLFQANTIGVVPLAINKLSVPSPIGNFTPARVISGNLTADDRYEQMINFDKYDFPSNNLLQYTSINSTPTSVIWDYNNQYPIAQIKNATYNNSSGNRNIAYTSFEADGLGSWNITNMPVVDPSAPTGYKVLSGGSASLNNFDLSTSHVLTYWTNGSAATVYAGGSLVVGNALKTVNGWSLYLHNIPVITSNGNITISGFDKIDELKTYPKDAQMTTFTYDPLVGMTSSTDVRGETTYYEYDSFQRLKNIKDQKGNVLKNYCYNYAGQQTGCPITGVVGNQVKTQTFRKACGTNQVGSGYIYTVPANTYFAPTQDQADALAQADVTANGQNNANVMTNGTCTLTTTPYAGRIQQSTSTNGTDQTDVWAFRLYADAEKTLPFTATGSITIKYKITTITTSSNPTTTVVNNYTVVIPAGSSQATVSVIMNTCAGNTLVQGEESQASAVITDAGVAKSETTGSSDAVAVPNSVPINSCTTRYVELSPGTGYLLYAVVD